MLELLFWIAVFIISLLILIKSSDFFTDSAEHLGLYLGMNPFIVGVTIVAIGTSLPELVTSLVAVGAGATEIVAANVIGSNITNIFLILGLAAALSKKRIHITRELVNVDLPLLLGSAFIFAITVLDGEFTFPEALICVLGIIIYLWYTLKSEEEESIGVHVRKVKFKKKDGITLLLSGLGIYLGSKFLIDAVLQVSSMLDIGTHIIAVGAIALGTSLPELMVTISAAKKGKSEMAVGNILGSNIFNSFAVMGITGLFGTLVVAPELLTFALPLMIVGTIMYFIMTQDKQLTKWEGMMLLLFYALFIVNLFS